MTPRSTVLASITLLGSFVLGRPAPAQGRPVLERDSRRAEVGATMPVVLEGFVLTPDGSPAEGARVSSSAGGSAVADRSGAFRLEIRMPLEAESVELTALGTGDEPPAARTRIAVGATGVERVGALQLVTASTCDPSWKPTFGADAGPRVSLEAVAVFDDGVGPALYAGGWSSGLAKWNGTSWSTVEGLFDYPPAVSSPHVAAMAVYDDGSGPALYVGGIFSSVGGVAANNIAKWDGASWSSLGGGITGAANASVEALAVFDDGSGPVLVAGCAGTAEQIAKWDGTSWSSLGGGMNSFVYALTTFDGGSGPALYAGGIFTTAGGVPANGVAKWDGASWSALESGVSYPPSSSPSVSALAAFDDGNGPALYVGGNFTDAGGVTVIGLAKWDGSSWSGFGNGVHDWAYALGVYDDGGGPELYAGGGGQVAKWDGSTWSTLDTSWAYPGVNAFVVYDDGTGPELVAAGNGNLHAPPITKWNGTSWSTIGRGVSDPVYGLVSFDDGGGTALYACGDFEFAGGHPAKRVARWDGTSWSNVGEGFVKLVRALEVFDDGSGPRLYAGGDFVGGLASWDGSSWSIVSGLGPAAIRALAAFDDGGGPALYVGGIFTIAGDTSASRIAKWDGAWSHLGPGIADATVNCLAVHDDGSGPALFAGGTFRQAGDLVVNRIAKWDGTSWSALGSGVRASPNGGSVQALAVYDDGSGPALFVGGNFTIASGTSASRIAKWDGTSWSPLGSGVWSSGGGTPSVTALVTHDDGSGPALYVGGGNFNVAGSVVVTNFARWNGADWSPVGEGLFGTVNRLLVYVPPGAGRPALVAGGGFTSASPPDSLDSFVAVWTCTPPIVSSKVRVR